MMYAAIKQRIPGRMKRIVRRSLEGIRDSIAYRIGQKSGQFEGVSHIIFVCKGNICRSSFAEYYMKSKISGDRLVIESCGLDVDQGNFSPSEAVLVGSEYGLDLQRHTARALNTCDMGKADLIVPMEYRQYLRLKLLFPESEGKIRLLRDFAPWPECWMCNIDDPFGQEEGEFRKCFHTIKSAVDRLTYKIGERV
jgi:protein-tyrosine phosphatase